MTLPAGYYRIDPDIRTLVAAMNVHGFRTYASCQGHGFPVTKLPPYIAFACPVKMAALLEQRLRQDAESMIPKSRTSVCTARSGPVSRKLSVVWPTTPVSVEIWW